MIAFGSGWLGRLRWFSQIALLALVLMLAAVLSASATSYTDTFNSAPFSGQVVSFSTGDSDTGLTYAISGGDGGDFAWVSIGGDGNSAVIDILSGAFILSTTEEVTITSRDGKAFVFHSLWIDVLGDGVTIVGSGPESFTISAATGFSGDKSPVGGAKLVTKVELRSDDFYNDYLDTVVVELDVPGASVYGEGYLIKNGDSTASTADGTDLGLTPVGVPVTQDFEIRNLGDATLTLDANVTVTGTGFSITQQPSSSIAVGGSSTFTVSFNPTAAGSVTGTVTVSNNSEADDYEFEVAGEGDLDTDPPGLDSFERQTPGTQNTNADTLVFRATFDEDVQYVTTGDFAVTGSSATVTAVSAVSASVYDLTVSGGDLASYNGTVGINLAGGQDIADLADNALPAGEPATDETYFLDNTPPTDPTPSSSSHTVTVWDDDDTVDIQISGASDAGSGVDGFEIEWDQSPTWAPTEIKEQEETWSGETFTATSDGDWYFHIATVDGVGNWTSTQHLGPFQIDTTPPSVPTGLDPTSGSVTNDTSPVLSWSASTDTGGSGIRTTDAYRIVVTGPVNRDTYVSDTDYNPTLSEGTFTWKVYARDNAGNASAYTADHTLIIDATPPNVTIDKAAGQADPTNASPVSFSVVFDEPIDESTFTDTDVLVGGTAVTGAVSVTEIAPNDDTTFEVTVAVTGDGLVTATIPAGGIEDVAGNANNASPSSSSVYYDASKPSVTIDQATTQNDPTNTSPVVFTAVFDEPIESVSFTGGDVSTSGSATRGAIDVVEVAPLDGTTFEVRIDLLTDGNVVATIPAGVVQDPYGNTNNASTSSDNEVAFETDPPEIATVTPNVAFDANVGPLSVSITFDEPMDTSVNPSPTITGLATDPYTVTGSAWSNGDQTWTGSFTLLDDNETATGTYQISGFKDIAGNAMAPDNAKSIEVDTENPTVLSLDASDLVVTDADVGGGLFGIHVVFDDTMDTAVTPTIRFDPDVTAGATPTLVASSSSWSMTHRPDDTFNMLYADQDANVDLDSVSVDVTGGADKNGNPQENHDPVGEFGVDTLNPVVSGVTVSDPMLTQSDTGGLFTVTVDFSESMDLGDDPTIVFVPALPTTLSLASEGWVDTTTYEAVYDIADDDVIEESVGIRVSGASDVLGNGQIAHTSDRSFAVDTVTRERDDLIVIPAGSGGGVGFLDRWLDLEEGEEPPILGTLPLSAVYEIGETITGACTLTCSTGESVRDSRVFLYLYRTSIAGMVESREPVLIRVIRCDRDLGAYCFEIGTAELEPGIYDIYLGFEDGTEEILRIELIAPSS